MSFPTGWIETVGMGLEWAGIALMVIGAAAATVVYAASLIRRPTEHAYRDYRQRLGRAILLGLEFLVAGDIIGTVAVDPTWRSVGVLGVIVLIRTFLSFTLTVEIEGRWPWQRREAQ